MTFQQELNSWLTPPKLETSSAPEVGAKAPSSSTLQLPNPNGKPTIITFLRHCGCPFAEKIFRSLRTTASSNSSVNFIAVSHSDQSSTDKWLKEVGGAGSVQVIVDSQRELYAQWGLGTSSTWHVLNPTSMWNAYQLGKKEGIWNRPTESGSRWQTAGSFGVGGEGEVRWVRVAGKADEVVDFGEGVEAVG